MPHIHEKIDYAADVFIVNNEEVLLRMHDKYHRWFGVGGHVELDEDMVQAAIREVKEETGLDVTLIGTAPESYEEGEFDLLVPRFINRHRITPTHEHISFVYFGTSEDRDIDPAPGEQRDGFKWFSEEDLENPENEVSLRIRHYAKAALLAAAR